MTGARVLVELLDRHPAIEGVVVGLEHPAHAALAEHPHDAEATEALRKAELANQAEFLEIAYTEVMIAALLPALLYYFAIFIQVDLVAAREEIEQLYPGPG